MSRRRRQSLSPTLFPFLAVLVCTLGTLILLLALVAQKANQDAQHLAEESAQQAAAQQAVAEESANSLPTLESLQDSLQEEAFRLEQLVAARDQQTADLEHRRNQLANVEDHLRRISERLKAISNALESAADEASAPAATADELSQLKKKIVQQQVVVRQLRQEVQTAQPRFVIVPHQGVNGTQRRPLYVECHSKGVTIWPEGVQISTWYLENSDAAANPLDAALRAARFYALQNYGDETAPYPMLIVRPNGVESYYAARSAMKQWDDQFGYELVPHQMELAYPPSDPQMKQRVDYAVKEASRQVSQQSLARKISGRGGLTGGSAASRNRNAGSGRLSGNSDRFPAGQAGAPSRRSTTPPKITASQLERQSRQPSMGGTRLSPWSNPVTASNQPFSADQARRRLEDKMGQTAESFAGGQRFSPFDRPLDPPQTSSEGVSWLSENGGQPRESQSTQQPTPGASWSDALAGQPVDGARLDGASVKRASGPNSQPATEPFADSSGQPSGPKSDQPYATGDALQGGRPQRRVTGNASANMPNPYSAGPFGGGATDSMQQQARQAARQQQASQAAANAQQQATSSPRSQSASSGSPMVRPEGQNWALPGNLARQRGIEIVRSIVVEVYPDRFVLPAGPRNPNAERYSVGDLGIHQATLQLATSLRDRISRWGAAAPGSRWSPMLRVKVMPGAELRYQQLSQLMSQSGIEVVPYPERQARTPVGGSVNDLDGNQQPNAAATEIR